MSAMERVPTDQASLEAVLGFISPSIVPARRQGRKGATATGRRRQASARMRASTRPARSRQHHRMNQSALGPHFQEPSLRSELLFKSRPSAMFVSTCTSTRWVGAFLGGRRTPVNRGGAGRAGRRLDQGAPRG